MVCDDEFSSGTATSPPELLKIASADSSAESSFRELDDAFLQNQTRIWVAEVLQIRLDEHLIISELLADGELLFQVSKVVWKLLLAKHIELRHIKAYKNQPFASKRNSGRYRPYSNVDSFLKICKILGLSGIDLLSPSDVVERKNTRKVCMCIRTFSKKSRSMNINVPDFDVVTCMVAMPKNMVGCIRRSIELSHSILADSSGSYYSPKHATGKSKQGYSVTGSNSDYYTFSDQSDDTEKKHSVLQLDGSHTDDDELYDDILDINHDIPSPTVESDFMREDFDPQDVHTQQRNEFSSDELGLLCSVKSLQYHFSENIKHDSKLTWSPSPSCGDSHAEFIDRTSHLDHRVQQVQESRIMDFDYYDHALLSNNASVSGTPMNDKTSSTRDASSQSKDTKGSDLFQEENRTPNVHQSASSHGSNPTPKTVENGRCLSREAQNLGDQFDAENNSLSIESLKLHNDKNGPWDKIKEEFQAQDILKYKDMTYGYGIDSNARYSYFVKKFEETEQSLYSPDCYLCNTNYSDRVASHSTDISSNLMKKFQEDEDNKSSQDDLKCLDNASCNQTEEFLTYQSYSCKWDQKGKCAVTLHDEITPSKQKASEVLTSKVVLSSVPNKEDVASAVSVRIGNDNKELNNDSLALASNASGVVFVDDCERSPTHETNDVVVPASCDEDSFPVESDVTNLRSKFQCSDGHKTFQHSVYHSEHTRVVHIKEEMKPADESMCSLDNLVETEKGVTEIAKGKHHQKRLLVRSVLGGAAAVGFLFMFLHLRRNGGVKAAQPSKAKASSQNGEEKTQKYSARKVKRSTTKGVYPAEKLNLK